MAKKKDYVPFTIRLPEELLDRVVQSAELHNRSRNSEVIELLTAALDAPVKGDLALLGSMRDRLQAPEK